jgi:hypothetical protein
MGHRAGKDVFRSLGEKIDGLEMRAPWTETFRDLLARLYSSEEADVVAKMPYTPSDFQQVKRVTGYGDADLRRILDKACSKGLVVDLCANGTYHYIPSPIMVGLFEFTMMRTAGTP